MFIKALEYETVNNVVDPKQALGEKYNVAAPVTPVTPTQHNHPRDSLSSGNTLDKSVLEGSGDTFDRSPALEGGRAARH